MSVSAVSGSTGSIRDLFQKAHSSTGITKEDLTSLQNSITDSDEASKISDFASAFDTIDIDGSGSLSDSEIQTYTRSMGLSSQGSGTPPPPPPPSEDLSKEDLTAMVDAESSSSSGTTSVLSQLLSSFDESDTNSDGVISQSEFDAFAKANGITQSSQSSESSESSETGPELSQDELASMAEENGDQLLSQLVSSFDEADTDGNGKISHDEFKAYADANGFKPSSEGQTTASSSTTTSDSGDSTSTDSTTTSANAALQTFLKYYLANSYSGDAYTSSLGSIAA